MYQRRHGPLCQLDINDEKSCNKSLYSLKRILKTLIKHLLEHYNCDRRYSSYCFTIIERTETTFELCVKEDLLTRTVTTDSQHLDRSVWKSTFHPIITRIHGEAATSLLKSYEDFEDLFGVFVYAFLKSCYTISKLQKSNHLSNIVTVKKLDK